MSNKLSMTAVKREGSGKGTARAIRRNKQIPAVIYGDNKTPVAIALDAKTLTLEYLKGTLFTTLCDLDVAGEKHLVLARDVQLDPVTDVVLHADFLRVTAKTKLRVSVPVTFINQDEAPGIKQGGTLSVAAYDVSVMSPANAIPDAIEIDLSGFEIGQGIRASELNLPKGVTPAMPDPENFTVASILAPRTRAAATEEDAADAGEGEAGAAEEEKKED